MNVHVYQLIQRLILSYVQPCNSLEDQLADAFEMLVAEEVIVSPDQEDEFNEEAQQWASRIKRTTMHSVYGDDVDDYDVYEREYQVLVR